MTNKWIQALKAWNSNTNEKWCVPKKGTTAYNEVKSIMGGGSAPRSVNEKQSAKDKQRMENFDRFEEKIRRRERLTKVIPLRDKIRGD
jgi:hypothetical protein